jgi:gamma-glutamyltranspeptidase / glutathione hydrolase
MRRRRAASALLTALATAWLGLLAATVPATAGGAATPIGKRPLAVGSGGAVVSDSADATEAGLSVLRRGGTAADAAVAVAATLGVTDPYVAGIGGGGYLVYYDARTRRVGTIDGRETAPARAGAHLFVDPATGRPLPFATAVTSGLSVGVPGTLMTWHEAVERWGRLGLAEDLRPAERIATDGFVVDATLREQTRENARRFAQFSSTSALFLPGGSLPAAGSVLRNPDLAATYRLIARDGVGALYGGAIGRDVVRAVHDLPLAPGATLTPRRGLLELSDLARYAAPERPPTRVEHRGLEVDGMAPSSSGGITDGEALRILGTFDLPAMSGVEVLHHYLEASRLAFADRNRYVGDSGDVDVPQRRLLSASFARARACLIDPDHALRSPVAPGDLDTGTRGCPPARPVDEQPPEEGGSTNHLVVADRWGDVASYTTTIEELGGSGIAVPYRGFLLNNELTDFDFAPIEPGVPDPNLPAGGKRPRSSMSPTIVLRDARPFLALGSPGGGSIITTVLQILVDRLDLGMSLEDAIAAPRASQRNTPSTQVEPAFLDLPATPGLERLGHTFSVSDTSPLDPSIRVSPEIGAATALEFLGGGRVLAAGEPVRRGGGAAGTVDDPCRPGRSEMRSAGEPAR